MPPYPKSTVLGYQFQSRLRCSYSILAANTNFFLACLTKPLSLLGYALVPTTKWEQTCQLTHLGSSLGKTKQES